MVAVRTLQDMFTPRQLTVARLLIGGFTTTASIAAELGLSYETVKTHIFDMCNRTGMDDRTGLALFIERRKDELWPC
jgi:DNA-binding NarL/FixJ family response regulator